MHNFAPSPITGETFKSKVIMEDKITEKVYCYDHPSAHHKDTLTPKKA